MRGTIVRALSGFYYVLSEGETFECRARGAFRNRKQTPLVGDEVEFGEGTVETTLKDSYRNMREIVEKYPEILERADRAFRKCGIEPVVTPIRGGTDGARLSYMGLPCPNLSTGGYNFHGRKELIPVQAMEKMVDVLEKLVTE